MSGICSKHRDHHVGCAMCEADINDVLPDYDRKVREAEACGEVTCPICGFEQYANHEMCVMCSFSPLPVCN